MIFILFIGIILFYTSWDLDNKIQDKDCKSTALKTANKIVLCIGTTFIVSSLSFFTCSKYTGLEVDNFKLIYYVISLFIFGIVLIVLGSMMSSGANTPGCKDYGNPGSVLAIGIVIVLSCSTYFYLEYKKTKESKKD